YMQGLVEELTGLEHEVRPSPKAAKAAPARAAKGKGKGKGDIDLGDIGAKIKAQQAAKKAEL
ncbi:hypothetical protein TeGR_g4890, partial [Tetraparma gracilis]